MQLISKGYMVVNFENIYLKIYITDANICNQQVQPKFFYESLPKLVPSFRDARNISLVLEPGELDGVVRHEL